MQQRQPNPKKQSTGEHEATFSLKHFDKALFLSLVILVTFSEIYFSKEARVFPLLLAGSFTFIATTMLNLLLKTLFRHKRPMKHVAPKGHPLYPLVRYSFPSYHTQIGFSMVTVAALFLHPYSPIFSFFLVSIAVVTAGARLVSKAHYPKDIIAGAMLGSATGWYIYAKTHDLDIPILTLIMLLITFSLFFAIPLGRREGIEDEK